MDTLTSAMRTFLLCVLWTLPLTSICGNSGGNFGNPEDIRPERQELGQGFYVVVGAFNIYENAQRYSKDLGKQGFDCHFAYSDMHHRYYAYVYFSDSLSLVKKELFKVRENASFNDAWILKIGQHLSEKKLDENGNETPEALQEERIKERKDKLNANHNLRTPDLSKTHNAYKVYINPCSADLTPISAKIKVVNGEKAVLLKTIESQKQDVIYCPKSYSQTVEFICENVIGYRKKVFYVDLSAPMNDTTSSYVKVEGDQITINLPLEQMKQGDIMTLFNVFFYPNTNILRSKSNYELQQVLEILKKNPDLKIMIHGHVNGNSWGPITRIKEDTADLFNPAETEVTNASSHKLSELRAETIRYYFIRNGIEAERLQTKGWGGKKMLYKEDSPMYEYNVRVEVEVLEN